MTNQFLSLTAAYLDSLRELHTCGRVVPSVAETSSVGSDFGQRERPFRELLNHTFVLTNPRNRVVTHPVRRVNVPFAFASALWTLAGSDSLAFIDPYNPRGAVLGQRPDFARRARKATLRQCRSRPDQRDKESLPRRPPVAQSRGCCPSGARRHFKLTRHPMRHLPSIPLSRWQVALHC